MKHSDADKIADGVMLLIEHCEEHAEQAGRGETLEHLYDMHRYRDLLLFQEIRIQAHLAPPDFVERLLQMQTWL